MEEMTARSPIDGTPMRPSVARAVSEMRTRAPIQAANGIFQHPHECTQEERNFIADCLKRNIPLYTIASMIHCERSYLSRYIKNHPELQLLKDEQAENIVDEAEYQLDRLNRAGNASTIIFTLQTKGRKRGWTTEDVSGEGGGQEVERIVMGIIPDEAVKEAQEQQEKVMGKPVNPGGVMTDPMSVAAMEEAAKKVKDEVLAQMEAEKPQAIDAESIEVGPAPYGEGGGVQYGEYGDTMGDPWAAGADSPFSM